MNRAKYRKEKKKLIESVIIFVVGFSLFLLQLLFIYINGPYQGNLIRKYIAYLCDASVYPKGKGIILLPFMGLLFFIIRLVRFVNVIKGKI